MKSRSSIQKSSSSLMKREFLRKWMEGLQIYRKVSNEMTVLERKQAIKLSADIAIASTRSMTTRWRQAAMAGQISAGCLQNTVTDESVIKCRMRNDHSVMISNRKKMKARRKRGVQQPHPTATLIAKKLVMSKTRVLKKLVPGGHGMKDDACLIKETLDYIASLQVQVDVMRHIAAAAEGLAVQEKTL